VASELRGLPRPEMVFNYLGQLDQALPEGAPFAPAAESCGPLQSPRNLRPHPLEIAAGVARGRFHTVWTWGAGVLADAGAGELAEAFVAALRELVAHCRTRQSIAYTPTDFPDVHLSAEDLARALAEIELE